MIDKPVIVPINDQVEEKLGVFMQSFNNLVNSELAKIEKEVETIKDVLKHHRSME